MTPSSDPAFADQPGAARPGATPSPGRGRHTFGFADDGSAFLLDGQPFQIRSGELHPARIPVEYWRHRIRMARAMGMNTITVYVMWNYIEEQPGSYDFSTGRRNVEAFVELCQEEGMWVLMRPGPYVCAEWDLGGIPSYLLRHPDIALRVGSADDSRYLAAVTRYFRALIPRIKPLTTANGGPILMIQIENEYGAYGSDQAYLQEIRQLWIDGGVPGPFCTQDKLDDVETNRTNVSGAAIGLSGGDAGSIAACRQAFPDVPAFGGEVYPGWYTHWGDGSFQGEDADLSATLQGFMDGGLSFSLYMIHGGTSFGYFAGANADDDGSNYQPDITSYDYGAPITEQGVATGRYARYRDIIARSLGEPLPEAPAPIPTIARSGGGALTPQPYASIWDNLPAPLPSAQTKHPQPMEMYDQSFGFVLYRTTLDGFAGGTLNVRRVHDYATVFLDGQYVGGFSRPVIPDAEAQQLNVTNDNALGLQTSSSIGSAPTLDILVEGMGRTNYGRALLDRKGIVGSVALEDAGDRTGTLTDWQVYSLPMDATFVAGLHTGITDPQRPGLFFRTVLDLDTVGDTYIDVSNWTKGVVWVNGHNLGRYWEIGPQHRLYCPASWLRRRANEIVIFDLHQTVAGPITFERTLG